MSGRSRAALQLLAAGAAGAAVGLVIAVALTTKGRESLRRKLNRVAASLTGKGTETASSQVDEEAFEPPLNLVPVDDQPIRRGGRHLYALQHVRTSANATVQRDDFESVEEMAALARAIQENTSLTRLCFHDVVRTKSNTPFPTQALVDGLKASTVITLELRQSGLHCEEMSAIAAVLHQTSLQKLHLIGNKVGVPGMRALGAGLSSARVTELLVMQNKITGDGASALAEGLKSSSVTALSLCSTALEDEGAEALAIVLGETSLLSLDLTWNNIGVAGARALAESLKSSRVTELNAGCNKLLDEGAEAFALVLKETPLLSLDLYGNNIGVAGARALAESLKSSRVMELTMGGNKLRDKGAEALASCLKETSLQRLGLNRNNIGVHGARALAEGLKFSSVTSLNLADNGLGDDGVAAVAAALPETSLEILDFAENRIGVEGARALGAGLKSSSVTRLCLDANQNIGDEGAEALLEGLRDSPVLEISLQDGDRYHARFVNLEILRQIKTVLEVNKARTFLLQMEGKMLEDQIQLKFRTLAGSIAAALTWSSDRPVQDLPEAVMTAMRGSGYQPPFKGLSAVHLKLVRPDGAILDVSPLADSLAQQLKCVGLPVASP